MEITTEQLNKELEEIDKMLREENLPIPGRPIKGALEFAKRHQIGIPLSQPIPGTHHESYQYWPITQYIMKWFDERYGDRLAMDAGPGKCAFLLKGDPWYFHYPKFWGNYRFGASRTHSSEELEKMDCGVDYNVLDAIPNMPSGLKKSASDDELREIIEVFQHGLHAMTLLDENKEVELIKFASADIESAVDHIMSRRGEYGLSKWASLQAAEKVIKSCIQQKGDDFIKTHNLSKLLEQLSLDTDLLECIARIQCSPAIRYGEEPTSLQEAVDAHHAVLEVHQNCDLS